MTADRLRDLGATTVIDYTTGPVAEQVRSTQPDGVDALINLTGYAHDARQVQLRGDDRRVAGRSAELGDDDDHVIEIQGRGVGRREVARPHHGRRRIETAQVAVYLTYTAPRGHALIDRALYLPQSWVQDPERRAAAAVPTNVEFATKPARRCGGSATHWMRRQRVLGDR